MEEDVSKLRRKTLFGSEREGRCRRRGRDDFPHRPSELGDGSRPLGSHRRVIADVSVDGAPQIPVIP